MIRWKSIYPALGPARSTGKVGGVPVARVTVDLQSGGRYRTKVHLPGVDNGGDGLFDTEDDAQKHASRLVADWFEKAGARFDSTSENTVAPG